MDSSLQNNSRKVLHVRSTIGMYGAERVLLNTLPIMTKTYGVSLLTLEGGSTESATLRILAENQGITCLHYNPSGKFDRQLIKGLREIVKKNSYSIIHTHDYKSLFYFSSIARKLNIPIVHHVHGALGNSYLEKIYGTVEKWLMRSVSEILTVSSEQKISLEKSYLSFPKILQVNNGTLLEPLKLRCSQEDPLKLIMVARLTEEKNHLLAIEAIGILKSMGVKTTLTLLGDGSLRDKIQQRINDLSLNEQVNLVGFTSDVQHWLDISDVLLITSDTEGMPMNMLEAMGRGLPVISTAVGEIPFLIKTSGCGAIFSNRNELIRLIEKVTKEVKVWRTYGKNGRVYIENNLSVKSQSEVLIGEYNEILRVKDV